MADDDKAADAGFLSRWSRRKQQLRQGVAPPEPARLVAPSAVAAPVATSAPRAVGTGIEPKAVEPRQPAAPSGVPALTLADVDPLDYRSDFTRFVAPGVDSQVKNAALKKLFTDPHFNVMDRLDTYIDDYGLPDPLPAGMLQQMAQSQFLGLFDPAPELADAQTQPSATTLPIAARQAASADALELPDTCPDENPALRLQPLDAAGPTGPDQGPVPDPGREH